MVLIKKFLQDNLLKKLLKNASILLSGNVITQGIGLISLVLTTRLLGPELFGVLVVIQNYNIIIDNLFNFQSWQAIIKYGIDALEKKKIDIFKGYIKFGVLIDITTAILATVIAIISIQLIGPIINLDSQQVLLASIYSLTILFNWSGTPIAILRIYDKFKLFAYQQIISSIIKLTGILIATFISADIWFVVFTWIFTDIIGNLILFVLGQIVLYKNNIKEWWQYKIHNFKGLFQFSWWTNLNTAFDIPVKYLDVLILSSLVSFESVSIFRIYKQIGATIDQIANPIYQAIYPQLVKLITIKKTKKAFNFSLRSGLLISILLLPFLLLIIVFSPKWLNVIFGNIYALGWYILAIYIGIRLLSVVFICIHPLFIAMGFVKQNILIIFVTNLLYLISSIFFVYQLGLIGIVLSYGLQVLAVVVWKIHYIIRNVNNQTN